MRTYSLFGATLASDFPFETYLDDGQGRIDLTFRADLLPFAVPEELSPVYSSPLRTPDGDSVAHVRRLEGCDVMSFSRAVDFYVGPDWIRSDLHDEQLRHLVEIRLLGPVLAYWMERRGLPTLHASAIQTGSQTGSQAVALLGRHGGGKSSLAAALMQAGAPLLTDDILPVEERDGVFFGRPGYPQMRMWPDQADHFLGHHADLPIVHPGYSKRRVAVGPDGFGAFHGSASPLAGLYIAERREEGPVEIRELSPREAFFELVRHSFTPYLVEAAGLQPARIDLFARLVQQVPVRRLTYPSGFERLPAVAEAVLSDLERARPRPPC